MRKEKRGRKPDPVKARRTLEVATRYLECLERGLTMSEAITELKEDKFGCSADGTGGIFLGEEVIRNAVEESRRICILDDEFRLSKRLHKDPEWQEVFRD